MARLIDRPMQVAVSKWFGNDLAHTQLPQVCHIVAAGEIQQNDERDVGKTLSQVCDLIQ